MKIIIVVIDSLEALSILLVLPYEYLYGYFHE